MEESGQEKTRVVNLAKKREGLAETVGELLAFNDERGLWLILNRRHRADLGDGAHNLMTATGGVSSRYWPNWTR